MSAFVWPYSLDKPHFGKFFQVFSSMNAANTNHLRYFILSCSGILSNDRKNLPLIFCNLFCNLSCNPI